MIFTKTSRVSLVSASMILMVGCTGNGFVGTNDSRPKKPAKQESTEAKQPEQKDQGHAPASNNGNSNGSSANGNKSNNHSSSENNDGGIYYQGQTQQPPVAYHPAPQQQPQAQVQQRPSQPLYEKPSTQLPPTQPQKESLNNLPPPPKMEPLPARKLPPQQLTGGSVKFAVLGILNQGGGHQITNDGYRLQLTNSAGQLVVSAPINVYAMLRGEAADAGQSITSLGKPFVLNAKPEFVAQSGGLSLEGSDWTAQGTQQLKMDLCLPKNPSAPFDQYAECADIKNSGHTNGINHIRGATATVAFYGSDVAIQRIENAGSYGDCQAINGMPCVALAHATTAAFAKYPGEAGEDKGSPLVLDLSRTGSFDLISAYDLKRDVYFDVSGAGEKVRTGWIGKKSGLLAMDVDGDGQITSGKELFGEYSASLDQKVLSASKMFVNGFAALAQYDVEKKGFIDASNPIFAKLVVWTDLNANGKSEAAELRSLTSLGIKKLNLTYVANTNVRHKSGNDIPIVGSYETTAGKTYKMADVYFELRTRRAVAEILNEGLSTSSTRSHH